MTTFLRLCMALYGTYPRCLLVCPLLVIYACYFVAFKLVNPIAKVRCTCRTSIIDHCMWQLCCSINRIRKICCMCMHHHASSHMTDSSDLYFSWFYGRKSKKYMVWDFQAVSDFFNWDFSDGLLSVISPLPRTPRDKGNRNELVKTIR